MKLFLTSALLLLLGNTQKSNAQFCSGSHVYNGLPITMDYDLSFDEATFRSSVAFEIVYDGLGWLAWALSPNGGMANSLAVIGLPTEGTVGTYFLAGKSTSTVLPTTNTEMVISDSSITQNSTHTFLKFTVSNSRPFNTLEINPTGSNYFLVAAGSGNTLGYHQYRGSNRFLLSPCESFPQDVTSNAATTTSQTAATEVSDNQGDDTPPTVTTNAVTTSETAATNDQGDDLNNAPAVTSNAATTSNEGVRLSCLGQDPCHDMGDGWLAYQVNKIDETTGNCNEVCAGGASLRDLLDEGYQCGRCVQLSCPDQEPCNDYGNGFLAYKVKTILENGSCQTVCAAGPSLWGYLNSGDYECGSCVVNDFSYPTCPNQEPCSYMSDGTYGYILSTVAEDGTCLSTCAAGGSISSLLQNGYECGNCPELERPSCPDQDPCRDFGDGWLGYRAMRMTEDGICLEVCAAGNSLTDFLDNQGYVCGACPEAVLPTCPDQQPCREYENGWLGYTAMRMVENGVCQQVCAGGTSLAYYLNTEGFECGECPEPDTTACPGQEPCRDYGNGVLAYSAMRMNTMGLCEEVCAPGTALRNFLDNQGYTCGLCPRPSCPNEDSCADYGNGFLGYPIHRIVGDECYGGCAGGDYLTSYTQQYGYECGACPEMYNSPLN